MTTPTDRTAEEYRARIRDLAETKRKPRPDRKRQRRAAPDRLEYPWPTDLEVFDDVLAATD